jgi:hypothetical protein
MGYDTSNGMAVSLAAAGALRPGQALAPGTQLLPVRRSAWSAGRCLRCSWAVT